MSRDQIMGWVILLCSIGGVAVYFYLTFLSQWTKLVIQLTAFLAVAAVLLIMAWIGYTMATTPSPVPLQDLDLDEDLSEIEETTQGQ